LTFKNPPGLSVPHFAAIAPTPDGSFLVVIRPDDFSFGLLFGRFGQSGILEEFVPIDGAGLKYESLDLVPNGTGFVVGGSISGPNLQAIAVHSISASGAVQSTWTSPGAAGSASVGEHSPSLILRDGRIWVLYGVIAAGSASDVRLVGLGCR
jgi:hypothetical protein